MHPHLLFDLLAWLIGGLSGWALWRWRLQEVDTHGATRLRRAYLFTLAGGAIYGAFALGTLNLWWSGQGVVLGRSVAGAMLGAILAVEVLKRVLGIRGSTGAYFAAPLAVGIAVGRIGCFASGLDDYTYGIPSTGPFAVDMGDGVPRHPVALYETAAMGAFVMAYVIAVARRSPFVMASGFYLFIAWYGFERFWLEFLKPYRDVLGPLNLFQLVSAILFAYGVLMLLRTYRAMKV